MKKALKRSLSLLLAITIIIGSAYVGLSEVDFSGLFAVRAKAATSGTTGDCTWSLDGTVLTISGNGKMGDYSYSSATPWGISITKVVIKNGVTRIGNYAFRDCSNLTSITIPEGVTSIASYAFYNCTNLASITIPNGVTSIGEYAFYSCDSLTSITIPEGVRSIGYHAFMDCTSLTSITIPDSVTWMSGDDFYNTAYYNNSSNWENGVLYIGNHLIEAKTSINGAYEIKEGTKTIANGAFMDFTSLTSITIPDSVTSIGYRAFLNCESLTSITIPDSVTSIDGSAFSNCTSLTSIAIPDSVTSIVSGAFYNTAYYNDTGNWVNNVLYIGNHLITANTSITGDYIIKEGTKTIADEAFCNCTNLTSITIPDSVISIGDGAFESCRNLTSIIIPDGVTNIGRNAFVYSGIKSITIPESVTYIGGCAFAFTPLVSVTIPNSVTRIEYQLFDGCSQLVSVVIPDSVKSIDDAAFEFCERLKTIVIPDSVTSIGDDAFYGCTSLTSITIPDSVTSIGCGAFQGCELTDVYYGGTEADWANISIDSGNSYLTNATIHYHQHSYNSEWFFDVEPTCTEAGSKHNTCFACGEIITEEIPATGHQYDSGVVTKNATCEETGVSTFSCTNTGCNEYYDVAIPAINHKYDAGTVVVNPTCEATGIKRFTCQNVGCYDYYDTDFPATGHTPSTEWTIDVAPTCTTEGSKSHHCTVCGAETDVAEIEPTGHTYSSEWTVDLEPTGTTDGEKSRHCLYCSDRTDVIVIPRNISKEIFCVETNGFLCNGEITYIVKLKAGIGVEGAIVGAMFDPDVLEPIEDKSGPCTTINSYGDEVLSVNGLYSSGFRYDVDNVYVVGHINMVSQKFEEDTDYIKFTFRAKDTSVTETNVDFYCVEFNGDKSIPRNDYQVLIERSNFELVDIPHQIRDDWRVEKPATSIESGIKVKDCLVCGEVFETATIPQTVCDKPTLLSTEQVDDHVVLMWESVLGADSYSVFRKNGSSWLLIGEVAGNVNSFADMTVANNKEYSYRICANNAVGQSLCSDELSVAFHMHTIGDWITVSEPTCIGYGEKQRCCSGCDYSEVSVINPTGHINTFWVTELEPTCTVEGYKDEWCLDCGEIINTEIIPATGHSEGEWTVDVEPTCTESGSKHKTCSVCNELVTEMIPAMGHSHSTEWTVDIAPTCTGEGSKSHHCTVCGDKADVTVIEPTGHTYSDEWTIDVAPTCTEEGSKSHHCVVCNDDVTDVTVVAALGHDYKLVSVADEHPHTNTFKCSRCTETKTEASFSDKCGVCNFSYTDIDSATCRITGYIGGKDSFVIPATINGKTVTTTTTGAFKNNTTLTSVKIEDGVQGLGALAFLGCTSLSKIVIPESVTSIGANAFYNCASDFTIYCYRDSYAMQYAIDNALNYVVMDICETENSTIDYANELIYVTKNSVTNLEDIISVPTNSMAFAEASHIAGNYEVLGTGSIVTVFEGSDISSEYTIIVLGDTNGDSVCDALDAAQVALVSNGHKFIEGAYKMAADSNSDNIVDIDDYQDIVNKVIA